MPSRKRQPLSAEVQGFLEALPPSALEQIETRSGTNFATDIGWEVVRQLIFDVMCGVNIRQSTELLTRRRLALLNAATVAQYANLPSSTESIDSFVESVSDALERSPLTKSQEWMLNWSLGITGKGVQNVLRDDRGGFGKYTQDFLNTLHQAAEWAEERLGELSGHLRLNNREVPLSWFFVLYLATAIGSQTLTIRGSDKSLYGKLFEKLVLGSALHVLGFEFVPSTELIDPDRKQFWLSSTQEREIDATLLVPPGRGVFFDIGFIGRGNPEIVLDKIRRFSTRAEFGEQEYGMTTFVIVDRIGARGSVEERAKQYGGVVIQMSMSYWPQLLAKKLREKLDDYDDPELVEADHNNVRGLLKERLEGVPVEELLRVAAPTRGQEET